MATKKDAATRRAGTPYAIEKLNEKERHAKEKVARLGRKKPRFDADANETTNATKPTT